MPGAHEEIRKEDIGSPGIGVTDSFEPLWECWEPNPGPLQEQVVVTDELSFQHGALPLQRFVDL